MTRWPLTLSAIKYKLFYTFIIIYGSEWFTSVEIYSISGFLGM